MGRKFFLGCPMKFFLFSNLHLVLITLLLLAPWCNAQSPGQLVRRDWGKGSTENLSLVCACCHKITIWIQLQSHIFLVYPRLAIQHPLQVSTTAEPFLTLSLHGSGHGHGWCFCITHPEPLLASTAAHYFCTSLFNSELFFQTSWSNTTYSFPTCQGKPSWKHWLRLLHS